MELKLGYTILTKTGCKWCDKIKELLPSAYYINCDINDASRDAFYEKVDALSGTSPRTFPMVFLNKKYIGGYKDTRQILQCDYIADVDF